jgi:hypothetical protein
MFSVLDFLAVHSTHTINYYKYRSDPFAAFALYFYYFFLISSSTKKPGINAINTAIIAPIITPTAIFHNSKLIPISKIDQIAE